jgi:hypothetical protein
VPDGLGNEIVCAKNFSKILAGHFIVYGARTGFISQEKNVKSCMRQSHWLSLDNDLLSFKAQVH